MCIFANENTTNPMRHSSTYLPKKIDFSTVTFWDTDFDNIDWERHADFVIERVFGFGTENERQIVVKLYGLHRLKQFADNFVPSIFNRNVKENLSNVISQTSL
jgi:hypothetical protein